MSVALESRGADIRFGAAVYGRRASHRAPRMAAGRGGGHPHLLLALAWIGVWLRETGAALALAAAIAQITGWGFVAGRRTGCTWQHRFPLEEVGISPLY